MPVASTAPMSQAQAIAPARRRRERAELRSGPVIFRLLCGVLSGCAAARSFTTGERSRGSGGNTIGKAGSLGEALLSAISNNPPVMIIQARQGSRHRDFGA